MSEQSDNEGRMPGGQNMKKHPVGAPGLQGDASADVGRQGPSSANVAGRMPSPGARSVRGFWMAGVLALCLCIGDLRAAEQAPLVIQEGPPPMSTPPTPLSGSSAEYWVETWRTDNGLPGNTINAILQTRDGYLWLGTAGGLARFDGVRFTTPLPTEFKNTRITALCEDRSGRLWIGTQDSGLLCRQSAGYVHFARNQGLLDNTITCLAEDTLGGIWIGTPAGLNHFKDGVISSYAGPEALPHDSISGIHAGRSGNLWITIRTGVCQFRNGRIVPFENKDNNQGRNAEYLGVYEDRAGNLWAYGDTFLLNVGQGKRFNYFKSSDPSSSRVWTIFEGHDGDLWIGTSGRGLFLFRDGRFEAAPVQEGQLPNDIRAIFQDREGDLWVGSAGEGLSRLKPRRVRTVGNESGLPDRHYRALAQGTSERTLIGFEDGGLWQGSEGHFEPVRKINGFDPEFHIGSLWGSEAGGVWAGIWGIGLAHIKEDKMAVYTMANGLADPQITALCENSSGVLWIGAQGGQLQSWDGREFASLGRRDGLPGQAILCLLADTNGSVWAGTDGGGVVNCANTSVSPPLLGGAKVAALCKDGEGRLWVGTDGHGLAVVTDGKTRVCTTKDGLPSDRISQILMDNAGNLWLGVPEGIAQIPKTFADRWAQMQGPLRCLLYGPEDGLPASARGNGWKAARKAPNGKLWLATESALVVVNPAQLVFNELAPPVILENIRVNGQVAWDASARPLLDKFQTNADRDELQMPFLKIPPDCRNIEFQFTALSFMAPEKVRFKYRLEGFDPDWVDGGSARQARYGKLGSGTYAFKVTASNNDGVWSETGARVALEVQTPFWRTWWFLGLSGLAATGAITGGIRLVLLRRLREHLRRVEHQRAMEKERTRIAQDMHDEIGSKLTRISFLSEMAKAQAEPMPQLKQQIDSIALTSRELLKNLDEIVWAVNPRNDSLEGLASYLGQYATEYFQGTAIHCELDLPANLPAYPLNAECRHNVFLTFEEALNNALKHSGASLVRVEMSLPANAFCVMVADNGVGFILEKSAEGAFKRAGTLQGKRISNGLHNMSQRIADIGGDCVIESQPGRGVSVRLTIPLWQSNEKGRHNIQP
jgi:ligand-binding sensor domain-containing protein/signal transduction histidine kinase